MSSETKLAYLIDTDFDTVTGLPENLAEYIDYSMIAQAEGLKFGIEHFRRRKPHCSGTLFWQLNDCWPVLSWSVLDYYGFAKAGPANLSEHPMSSQRGLQA